MTLRALPKIAAGEAHESFVALALFPRSIYAAPPDSPTHISALFCVFTRVIVHYIYAKARVNKRLRQTGRTRSHIPAQPSSWLLPHNCVRPALPTKLRGRARRMHPLQHGAILTPNCSACLRG